jgi:hypothetical protein
MADGRGNLIGLIADEVCFGGIRLLPRPSFCASAGVIHAHMQDTVTGFLLAGVGNSDIRKKTNFLVVDSSARFSAACIPSYFVATACELAFARHSAV